MEIEESWEDDWPDDDYEDDAYYDDEDDVDTVECPTCGADVYEDAEQCPSCGTYIVPSSSGYVWTNRPAWWIVLGLIGILAVIFSLAFVP